MRVICIDADLSSDSDNNPQFPVEGKIYTVTGTFESMIVKGVFLYELAEFGKYRRYWTGSFAPLSDIDETELLEQRMSKLLEPIIVTNP